MSTALAPSLTAWAMRCAWTWPSSDGGVSQTISIGTLCFCDSSFAAASAPVRADRKTGLVELLAIMAIFSPRCPAGAAPVDGVVDSRPPHAVRARGMTKSAVTIVRRESVVLVMGSPFAVSHKWSTTEPQCNSPSRPYPDRSAPVVMPRIGVTGTCSSTHVMPRPADCARRRAANLALA